MIKREIAALACKILAIYAFILSLGALSTTVWGVYTMYFSSAGGGGMSPSFGPIILVLASVPSALYLAATFYLWLSADWLASRMIRDDGTALDIVATPALRSAAFALAGALALVQAIPELGAAFAFIYSKSANMTRNGGFRMNAQDFVTPSIKIVVGLWLLAGAPSFFTMLLAPSRWGMTQPRGDRQSASGDE